MGQPTHPIIPDLARASPCFLCHLSWDARVGTCSHSSTCDSIFPHLPRLDGYRPGNKTEVEAAHARTDCLLPCCAVSTTTNSSSLMLPPLMQQDQHQFLLLQYHLKVNITSKCHTTSLLASTSMPMLMPLTLSTDVHANADAADTEHGTTTP